MFTKGEKGKKKIPNHKVGGAALLADSSFCRLLIKGRESLAVFQDMSCEVGHKTSCNFQNHGVFFSGISGCIIKRLLFLGFAPYATFHPSFCMSSCLKACLVPSEIFKRENKS